MIDYNELLNVEKVNLTSLDRDTLIDWELISL